LTGGAKVVRGCQVGRRWVGRAALNFGEKPDLGAPNLHVPPFVSAGCNPPPAAAPAAAAPLQTSGGEPEWAGFAQLALAQGFEVL
jgi:hypothetical protein